MSDWTQRAACKGMAASIFYLEVGKNGTEAREICSGCPVAVECKEYARGNHEQFGIWAGTSPRDRGVHGYRRLYPVERLKEAG